ncbi:ADP-forming succinate--CoA ligase subunit beta [Candidatus Micrarchaeota archaeon]|nr:ADP-forming succinate--CoA ligase subunit beta [Candidatus Micrarchaeota archaeon]
MKLKEFEGKQLLASFEVSTSKGLVANTAEEAQAKITQIECAEVAVKAQVLAGGRGKAGGIKLVKKSEAPETTRQMLGREIKGKKIEQVLIEEKLEIEKEYYLSLTVNRSEKNVTLLFSEEGGVEIEELAKNSPEKIKKIGIEREFNAREVERKLSTSKHAREITEIAGKMFKLMKAKDAELVEINPLAISRGKLVAADAKIIIDDNALYRQPEFAPLKQRELSESEKKAKQSDLNYVELDGDIAIIGNGAGLVMATLDIVQHFGGKPANFLDVGGGANFEQVQKAVEIVLEKNPKGIWINVFGGITRCDDVARGLANYKKEKQIKVPIVVRLIGTNEAEGKKILEENGISTQDSMEECAKKIVELTR